jgi:TPR repeat protein
MRFKLDEYLLIVILFLTIDNVNARVPTLEEIAANEEYRLKMDYNKKTCLFVDEDTDFTTKKQCFNIVNRLYEITKDKRFLYDIAEHYFDGYGVNQNLKKGLKLMKELANSSHEYSIQAQATLGIYYGADDTPKAVKDLIKGEYWTKKAAENGDALSQYRYARILLKNKGKFNDAIHWYKKAADNGSVRAKTKLGALFNEGCPVQLSRDEICKLLLEAVEQNHEPAFQELYLLYYNEGNYKEARFWYDKFINSDYFKKVQAGMDPDDAIIEVFKEQKKKAYIEEVNKEMEEIEKQSNKKQKNE